MALNNRPDRVGRSNKDLTSNNKNLISSKDPGNSKGKVSNRDPEGKSQTRSSRDLLILLKKETIPRGRNYRENHRVNSLTRRVNEVVGRLMG